MWKNLAKRNNVALVQFAHCMKATTFGSSFGEDQILKIISVVKKAESGHNFTSLGLKNNDFGGPRTGPHLGARSGPQNWFPIMGLRRTHFRGPKLVPNMGTKTGPRLCTKNRPCLGFEAPDSTGICSPS